MRINSAMKKKYSIISLKRRVELKNTKCEIEAEKRKKEEQQLNNEKKYSVVIKFVLDEINKRPHHSFSKLELTNIILDVFSNSKYLLNRFERRRT